MGFPMKSTHNGVLLRHRDDCWKEISSKTLAAVEMNL